MVKAASLYHQQLPGSPAAEYLATRGLMAPSRQEQVDRFKLGYVGDPRPGHSAYAGMLCIPYIRYSLEWGWTVVSLRFRKLVWDNRSDDSSKYLTMAGDRPRMFNTFALLRDTETIAITEGEIDAVTAEMCGVPTVGIPGATSWQKHFREPFLGYRSVFILADGDEPGAKFAHGIAKSLPNAKVIPSPDGEDVNSLVVKHGPAALLERLK